MSFTSGLNGLNAAAQSLEVIGNNISNSSTIGYKGGQIYFSDVLMNAQSTVGAVSAGSGVATTGVLPQFTQGNITVTNNTFDVAVNGGGLFVVNDGGNTLYTRAGQFSLDSNGFLVNAAGQRVQGFLPGSAGTLGLDNPVDLQLSRADVPPTATTTATLALNLDTTEAALNPASFRLNDATTYGNATSFQVYDNRGTAHNLSLYFAKDSAGAWNTFAALDGSQVGSGPVASLKFGANGQLDAAATGNPVTLSLPVSGGATSPLAVSLDLSGATATGSAFSVSKATQDGLPSGQLTTYAIATDGTITGTYSNGATRSLGRLALASFNNLQGLRAVGTNCYAATAASGAALVGAPGTGTYGSVQSGALESSNVDLTAELVRMLEAQRVYQANAQAIKAEDTVLQTVTNNL